ncbi:hypothetical protein HPB52_014453 [Rhipicephalus sanguineus]|uniref:Uncharacterized protein n=1 Tax=Rhipicephalus sanguineus TaxID=34632 RepID=A0A9D4TAD7_RHISA|nr:hypothetical protein HPB52_014453 [Rhipicephalus sanguineus]
MRKIRPFAYNPSASSNDSKDHEPISTDVPRRPGIVIWVVCAPAVEPDSATSHSSHLDCFIGVVLRFCWQAQAMWYSVAM